MKNLKKIWILLIIILLTTTTCFSSNISTQIKGDSIVYVTPQQIKYANLIFVEHKKLLIENSLLNDQINNYICLNKNLEKIDSLRLIQLNNQIKINNNLSNELKNKNKTIKYLKVGGITITTGLLILLLWK